MKKESKSSAVKRVTIKSLESKTMLDLVEGIVRAVNGQDFSKKSLAAAHPYCRVLGKRMNLTENEALWLSVFVSMFEDNNIQPHDLGRFFDTPTITILNHWSVVESLIKRKMIENNHSSSLDISLRVPGELMLAMRNNTVFVPKEITNLTLDQLVDEIYVLLNRRDRGNLEYSDFTQQLKDILTNNMHLPFAQKLKSYDIEMEDLIVLLRTICNLVQNDDEEISYHDINDLFERNHVARIIMRQVGSGTYVLQKLNLIENKNEDGRANTAVWHLTDEAKQNLLEGLDLPEHTDEVSGLMKCSELKPKNLYFNADVTKQVDRLKSLLSQERFASVQERLEKNGMRRGFACIFYGTPGTGKTETVYQLARETGRNIMLVDVPSLRSKWVGESEKNIKAVFARYKRLVKESSVAPILLFNEADGVLNKRTSAGMNPSVEKMENTMQNIILQEMEDLTGIMIATTNLTDNLDDAFERRFLYKIEFPKPTPNESCKIWKAMLPDLSESEAYDLARDYDFSGGQIENVARKRIVDAVLNDEDILSMDALHEACSCERLNTKAKRSIGFA